MAIIFLQYYFRIKDSYQPINQEVPSLKPGETGASNFQLNLMLGKFSSTCSNLGPKQILLEIVKDLNQRMEKMMNLMLQFDNFQKGTKVLKSGIRDQDEVASGELFDLLKKTQTKVSSLENEIKRVEAENIHQDSG